MAFFSAIKAQSGQEYFLGYLRDAPKKVRKYSKTDQERVFYLPQGLQVRSAVEIQPEKEETSILIVLEEDSEARLLYEVHPNQKVCGMEVSLAKGAKLILQTIAPVSGDHSIRQHGTIGEDARIQWKNHTFTEGNLEQEVLSEVQGADAESSIEWIFHANGKSRQQLSAHNIFHASGGRGEITLKGVAEDEASVTCNGKISIGLKGNGTDAYLTEDVLMLDETAKVDAVPALEIKTNDVKASHSVTVRRLTPEELFYFSARGIATEEARKMYVEGFLSLH